MPKIPFLLLAVVLALAACVSGKPRERINPPTVSLQELRFDGPRCELLIRVHNHSSVGMRYSRLEFHEAQIDGRTVAFGELLPELEVPPYTGEPFRHEIDCGALSANASELVYRLEGRIVADQPHTSRFPFRHQSRLLPVPGLSGVYR